MRYLASFGLTAWTAATIASTTATTTRTSGLIGIEMSASVVDCVSRAVTTSSITTTH